MRMAGFLAGGERSAGLPVREQPMLFGTLAFLVLVLLGPFMTFTNAGGDSGEGNLIRQALYLLLLAVLLVSARPLADPQRVLVVPIPILAALAWCWISLAWAIDPNIAVRRLGLTSMVIWSVFIAVRNLSFQQVATLIRIVLVATLVANFVAVFAFPQQGIHQFNMMEDKKLIGDWCGILMHKNLAGAVCAITILAFAFDAKNVPWPIRVAVIAASAVFLAFSQSKTSAAMVGGALLVGFLFDRYRSRYRSIAIVAVFVICVAACVLVFVYQDPLKGNFTNPKGFTGRIQIWNMLAAYAEDHWYSGAGFGSFWSIGGESPVYEYGKDWVTALSSGHCGYVDVLVTTGIVGLVLIVFAMIVWPSIRLLSQPPQSTLFGAMPFSILFFCAGHNATESSIFDRDVIVNVFMLLSVALIERVVERRDSARNPLSAMRSRRSEPAPAPAVAGGELWEHLR
jgi:exopolysaccharide production protein ExoQ